MQNGEPNETILNSAATNIDSSKEKSILHLKNRKIKK
jgi:hypothetical protein